MVSQMLYASPAWWGFVDETGKKRLQAVIDKAKRRRFLSVEFAPFEELCCKADDSLFANILKNKNHVLYSLLPPVKHTTYNLRSRVHNREIPLIISSKSYAF